MKALIQRVTHASVEVENEQIAQIDQGLLVFLGVEKDDTEQQARQLVDKVCAYRVFSDAVGKMNLSVSDIGASVLIVSQFTLAANTQKGLRPSFSSSAQPDLARHLYEHFVAQVAAKQLYVATGRFGADMKVSLVNDGPVTFLLSA